jgi:SAM-dependent methyltransferase
MTSMLRRFYPEVEAGGFSRVDGTVEFFSRVNALLHPSMVILDFGAGRGAQLANGTCSYRRNLSILKGKVRKVIGVDVDPVVLENEFLDQSFVIRRGAPLPLSNESIGMIVSDWTFEHIDDPAFAAAEFARILKPQGWICARTPNKWGYIGLGANLVPNKAHARVLKRLQPDSYRETRDVYPTTYKMNTIREISRLFPSSQFDNFSYTHDSEPTYCGTSPMAWHVMTMVFRLTPAPLRSVLMVFLRRKTTSA